MIDDSQDSLTGEPDAHREGGRAHHQSLTEVFLLSDIPAPGAQHVESVVHMLSGVAIASAAVTASAKLTVNYSIRHLMAAAYHARQSKAFESGYDGTFTDAVVVAAQAPIVAALFSSVAYLEALINEVFIDAGLTYQGSQKRLDADIRTKMAALWLLERVRLASILDKFEIALRLTDAPAMDKGAQTYQNVKTLIKLRNALVHYNAEAVGDDSIGSDEKTTSQDLRKILQGKFSLSPVFIGSDPFFPNKCLSYGCAKWASDAVSAFAHDFYAKIGLTLFQPDDRTLIEC